jgi:hypothetical protein
MKNIILLITIALSFSVAQVNAQIEEALVRDCAASTGDDATYLKDFVADLGPADPDGKAPSAKFSMVLSKNNVYKFTICNSDTKPGRGIIQLYDTTRLLGSTFNSASGKDYRSFTFKCQKTGVYHIFISFQDGEPGLSVGILSYVETL